MPGVCGMLTFEAYLSVSSNREEDYMSDKRQRVNDAVRQVKKTLQIKDQEGVFQIDEGGDIFRLDSKGFGIEKHGNLYDKKPSRFKVDRLQGFNIKDQRGNIVQPIKIEGAWEVHKAGTRANCALCTAAALITKDINEPFLRKTAGIVNLDLQQELGWQLTEAGLEAIWNQYSQTHLSDFVKDAKNPLSEWKQWQRDDAFVWYARNEPSLKLLLKPVTPQRLQYLADQIIGLAGYVGKKLTTKVQYWGFPGAETTASTALPFMHKQPDDTKFAVLTDEGLANYGAQLHWTYAEKQGGKVIFKDFQMDREGMPEPSASTLPLGPDDLHYKEDSILMIVLAFGNKLVSGGQLFKDGL
jgi:hypothetical protein